MEFTVYRVGDLDKASDYGRRHELFVAVDAARPNGVIGRLDGLFCSPAAQASKRWNGLVRHRRRRLGQPLDEVIAHWQLTIQVETPPPVYSTVYWDSACDAWDYLQAGGDNSESSQRKTLGYARRFESSLNEYWTKTIALNTYLSHPYVHPFPFHFEQVELLIAPEWIVDCQLLNKTRRRLRLPSLVAA